MKASKMVRVSLLVIGMATLWMGCSKDEPTKPPSAPTADIPYSDVNSYQPALTDPSGTVYAGDYFPFTAGNRWDFTGTLYSHGYDVMEMPGEPVDSTPTGQSGSTLAFFEIMPPRSVTLASGQHTLFPIKGYTSQTINGMTSTTIDTASYYEKANNSVYCRAVRMADGSVIEITDRILLKQPLSTGSSWETQPRMNPTDLSDAMVNGFKQSFGTNMQVTIDSQVMKTKAVVVGPVTIPVLSMQRQAVRIDEKMSVKITVRCALTYEDIPMNISICVVLDGLQSRYFVRDTGWVRMDMESATTTLAYMSAQGMTMTMRSYENETDKMELSAIAFSPLAKRSVTSKVLKSSDHKGCGSDGLSDMLAKTNLTIGKIVRAAAMSGR